MHCIALFTRVTRLARRLGGAALLCLAAAAPAQELASVNGMLQSTQQWLDTTLRHFNAADGAKLRMEVSVGQLDSRLRLAACARIEPYLPANTRLWGRTRIGLRCLEGPSRWNVFLPVTIKAFGPAWVLRSTVAAGASLREEDAVQAEVDWASEVSPILAEPAQWVGQMAAYGLLPGQSLRQAMIRPAQAFQAGASVRIVAEGAGFRVSSEGQALSHGVVGQTARVRTDSGRVISGVVLDGHTVKISL